MKQKALLRLEALQILTHITPTRRKQAEKKAFSYLSYMFSPKEIIASFANKPLEINLWPWNFHLMQQKRLLLPAVQGDQMFFYHVEEKNHLLPSPLGFLMPDISLCPMVDREKISVILVPALLFTHSGHRIGYGKGYFDRFLSLFPSIRKIGIGFHEQKIDTMPTEIHDIAVDELLLF